MTYGSVGTLEHVELLLGGTPLGLWDNWLQDIGVEVPELVVLAVGEEDDTGGLGVEGGWDLLDDLGEDLVDAGIRYWGLLLESIDGAASRNGIEESVRGSHFVVCV